MMRLLFLLLAFNIAGLTQVAQAQESAAASSVARQLTVQVQRINNGAASYFELQASGVVQATPQQAWQVLTDYARQHEFVPNLASSKIVLRNPMETQIEQKGTRRFLFIAQDIHLIVRAVEHPYSRIDVSLVSGDMKTYATRWELTPLGPQGSGGTRIDYRGKMEPDFFVPPLFGASMVQSDIRNMVLATLQEINKLAAATAGKSAAPAAPAGSATATPPH